MARRGELDTIKNGVAVYDRNGELEASYLSIKQTVNKDFLEGGIRSALKTGKIYKDHFFRFYKLSDEPADTIEIPYLCIIDGYKFIKQTEIADYCNVTRQAVSSAKQHHAKFINGRLIEWNED